MIQNASSQLTSCEWCILPLRFYRVEEDEQFGDIFTANNQAGDLRTNHPVLPQVTEEVEDGETPNKIL